MEVNPIESPISRRLSKVELMACRTGDDGFSYNAPNRQAETIKKPRPAASIRYSGQWSCSARPGVKGSRGDRSGDGMSATWAGADCAERRFIAFQCGVIAYRRISFRKTCKKNLRGKVKLSAGRRILVREAFCREILCGKRRGHIMVAFSAIRQGARTRNSGMATSSVSPAIKQTSRTPEYELALMERVCSGEKHLFYELIQPYERSVYIAAHSVLQNEADAEEVAQEAFLKAFSHLSTFRKESKFSTWLIQIAIHEARMKARKGRKGLY